MPASALLAARESCALRWMPEWGTLRVTGPDRQKWLNGLLTCDVQRARPGHAVWGLALSRTGKIQTVVWVLASDDALWLALAPGTTSAVHAEFDRMLVMEDAELEDLSAQTQWLFAVGPSSAQVPVNLGTALITASALDVVGLTGTACLVQRSAAAQLLADPVLDDAAWRCLRLERGVPEFGVDFGPAERPHEAGLDRAAVDWSKGCYLGQEVVCMQDLRGKVSRRIQRVLLPSTSADVQGVAKLGWQGAQREVPLTSAQYSARAQGVLGWALLPVPAPAELKVGSAAASVFEAQL